MVVVGSGVVVAGMVVVGSGVLVAGMAVVVGLGVVVAEKVVVCCSFPGNFSNFSTLSAA